MVEAADGLKDAEACASLAVASSFSVCLPHPGTVPGKEEDTALVLKWDGCEELGYSAIRVGREI